MEHAESSKVYHSYNFRISKKIDKYLKEEKKKYDNYLKESKLLILGSSDSGKSTLLKQIKLKYGKGFTDEERNLAKHEIILFIVSTASKLLNQNTSKNEAYSILKDASPENPINWEVTDLLKKLWHDEAIKTYYVQNRNIFLDNTDYFMNSIERILSIDYLPTNEGFIY